MLSLECGMLDDITQIWCMKDIKYVTNTMKTGRAISFLGGKEVCLILTEDYLERSATFTNEKPIDYHFCYCHAVDDHNSQFIHGQ